MDHKRNQFYTKYDQALDNLIQAVGEPNRDLIKIQNLNVDLNQALVELIGFEKEHVNQRILAASNISASIIGTIYSDRDYLRLKQVAKHQGYESLDAWIASKAVQQVMAIELSFMRGGK